MAPGPARPTLDDTPFLSVQPSLRRLKDFSSALHGSLFLFCESFMVPSAECFIPGWGVLAQGRGAPQQALQADRILVCPSYFLLGPLVPSSLRHSGRHQLSEIWSLHKSLMGAAWP